MYMTFEAATVYIRDFEGKKPAKNPAYNDTNIYRLIRDGHLERATPEELFVKDENGQFHSIGKVEHQALVTKQSVDEYLKKRYKERFEKGVNSKGGKAIYAHFVDGSKSLFHTISEAEDFFKISAYKIVKSIKTDEAVEVKVKVENVAEDRHKVKFSFK